MPSFLHDLGPEAVAHRQKVEEVKNRLGINHDEFDCWIYGFLENKKFNVEETVEKLHRRFAMEINELATYEITDYMRTSLRSGIIQVIGEDKNGRVTFYVTTRRDKPTTARREENKRTFDMMVSYGTRLRADNKRCQMAMLINQEKASMWSNLDMSFQADIALRISKFYPGGVDKMYICNMNRTLAAFAKPIFSRLPSIVSDRIVIIDDSEIKRGALLELFDESVLPVALGGKNDCDDQEHWDNHAKIIEEYYMELKTAVQTRGITVKEWELECISANTNTNNNNNINTNGNRALSSVLHSMKSDVDHLVPLKTCYSISDESLYNDSEISYYNFEEVNEWKAVMESFPRSLALLFLEELQRWRLAVESDETSARYEILDKHIATRKLMSTTLPDANFEDKKWYIQVPEPLRAFCRLLLFILSVINCIYFLGALIFLAVLSGTIIVTLFFGFFVKWNYVFPLGATLAIAIIQGATLCSRAVDILTAIVNRKVIPPFELIGTYFGGFAQIVLFSITVVIQFIIFCIYSVCDSPLRGLQVSFATGWLSAVFIVATCHVTFLFDWSTVNRGQNKKNSKMPLPFFMILDLREGQEIEDTLYPIRTSSYVICGIPIFLSMFFGIAFLISRTVGFAIASCTAAIISAFTVNFYSEALSSTLSSSLLRIAVWIACVVWLFDCYAFGFRNYNSKWGISVIISSILAGLFIVFALTCMKKDNSNFLLRLGVLSLVLFLIGCWISSFPLIGWKIGVFCIVMLIHSTIGAVFCRLDLTNIGGVFIISLVILLLIVSCTLLGWYGTSPHHTIPRSLSSITSTPLNIFSVFDLYHRYPICSLQTPGGIGVTDFSLLTELVNAKDEEVFTTDFHNWFGHTDFIYNGIVQQFDSEVQPWNLYRFDSINFNMTVLILHNSFAFSSILATTAWIGSIALSPLHIFLPTEWSTRIVYIISFVTHMIDFFWTHTYKALTQYLNDFKSNATNEIVLTGSGVAGGIASIAGAHSHTQTIIFGSPGLTHILRMLELDIEEYHKYVLAIGASNGILDNVGGQDITLAQKLKCNENSKKCLSMEFISSELLKNCDTSGRQHIPY